MIPKIIHQTWKTKELPENYQHWHSSIKTMHPGWEINLWTDEDNLELVKNHFPQLLDIYNALEFNIMRADIIRYMYMAIYGGYYLDLDYELFIPFKDITSGTQLLLPIAGKKSGTPVLGNCIFGSEPGHIFWKDVLEDLQNNPPIKKIYNKHRILQLTGPEFISRIYWSNPEKYNGTLPPSNVFHPPTQSEKIPDYKNVLLKKGSRGIHHCKASWLSSKNPLEFTASKLHSIYLKFAK